MSSVIQQPTQLLSWWDLKVFLSLKLMRILKLSYEIFNLITAVLERHEHGFHHFKRTSSSKINLIFSGQILSVIDMGNLVEKITVFKMLYEYLIRKQTLVASDTVLLTHSHHFHVLIFVFSYFHYEICFLPLRTDGRIRHHTDTVWCCLLSLPLGTHFCWMFHLGTWKFLFYNYWD